MRILYFLACWLPATALAMDAMPGEDRFGSMLNLNEQSAGASLGLTKIDDAYFLQLKPRFSLNLGAIGVGIELPLNVRLWPREGSDEDLFGLLRKEDWDEEAEWLKVIRHVRLGKKGGKVHLRYGELAGDIGHGTIVGRYVNNVDLNSFRAGAQFDMNTKWGGFETLVSDVDDLGRDTQASKLVALRMYSKPYAWATGGKDSILNRLRVGISWASDINAPMALGTADADDANPNVESTQKSVVYGADADLQVFQNALLTVTPYVDYNRTDRGGWGLHTGIMAVAKLPIGLDLRVPMRLEYRRFTKNYLPAYYGTFYEVERYAYPIGDAGGLPKWAWLQQQDSDEGINGLYGEAAFDFLKLVQVGAIYEAYLGYTSNLNIFFNVPALKVLQFKAYYARINIEGLDDLFVFDERSSAVAQARYELLKGIYLVARASRRWTYNGANASYAPTDEWNFGAEYSLSF
ncbi:MAG: hypothetical protein OSB21_08790 [Myxococcota bacterium]|jgi:hypothetical protein|nr:hypothetical protein [Myxococcota bacterium]